jgi:hypothetical protein
LEKTRLEQGRQEEQREQEEEGVASIASQEELQGLEWER